VFPIVGRMFALMSVSRVICEIAMVGEVSKIWVLFSLVIVAIMVVCAPDCVLCIVVVSRMHGPIEVKSALAVPVSENFGVKMMVTCPRVEFIGGTVIVSNTIWEEVPSGEGNVWVRLRVIDCDAPPRVAATFIVSVKVAVWLVIEVVTMALLSPMTLVAFVTVVTPTGISRERSAVTVIVAFVDAIWYAWEFCIEFVQEKTMLPVFVCWTPKIG
jgi:hypothetical protein